MSNKWNFDKFGNISDDLGNTIKFRELASVRNGKVYDINGNVLPITVADAATLSGLSADKFVLSDFMSNSYDIVNRMTGGRFSLTDQVKSLVRTQVKYDGRGSASALPVTGVELLPNTTFLDTTDITPVQDATLTVGAEGTLIVTAGTHRYPVATMEFGMVAGEHYRIEVTGLSDKAAIGVSTTDGDVLIHSDTVVNGYSVHVVTSPTDATGVLGLHGYSIDTGTSVSFRAPSIQKISTSSLSNGDYYSAGYLTDNKMHITTDIPSLDINYTPGREYSNDAKNNLAFFYNDFSMLQYIGGIPGKEGFVQVGDVDVEYIVDNAGTVVGNFTAVTDMDSFNSIGNLTKTHAGETMELNGGVVGDTIETYFDVETGVGKKFMLTVDITDITGQWTIQLGDEIVYTPARLLGTLNANKGTFRYIFTPTTDVSRFRLYVTKKTDSDKLVINELSLKELDASIWRDITPRVPGTQTAELEWDHCLVDIESVSGTRLGTYSARYNTLSGVGIINEDGTSSEMVRGNSIVDFNSKGVILGDREDRNNYPGVTHLLTQDSFNKTFMYCNELGLRGIVAKDPVYGKALVLNQYEPGVNGKVIHGLGSKPAVIRRLGTSTYEAPDRSYTTLDLTKLSGLTQEVNRFGADQGFLATWGGSLASNHHYDRNTIGNTEGVKANYTLREFSVNNQYHHTMLKTTGHADTTVYTVGFSPMDIYIKKWSGGTTQTSRIVSKLNGVNRVVNPSSTSDHEYMLDVVKFTATGVTITHDTDEALAKPTGSRFMLTAHAVSAGVNKLYIQRPTSSTRVVANQEFTTTLQQGTGIYGAVMVDTVTSAGGVVGTEPENLK